MCDNWVWQRFIDWCHVNHSEVKINVLELPFHGKVYNNKLGFLKISDYVDFLLSQKRNNKENENGDYKVGIGHSMGGLLVALVEANRKGKVYDALVLMSPAAPWGVMTLEKSVIKTFWSALTTPGFKDLPFRLTYEEVNNGMLNMITDKAKRDFIYNQLGYESGRVAFQIAFYWLDFMGNWRRDSYLNYQQIECPVLILVGEEDLTTPVNVVEKIFKKINKKSITPTTFKIFSEMGHWLPDEPKSEKVFKGIFSWISQSLRSIP